MIWHVDATTYKKEITLELREIKNVYARIKTAARKVLPVHLPPREKTYSVGLLRIASIISFNGCDVKYVHIDELDANAVSRGDTVLFSATCAKIDHAAAVAAAVKRQKKATCILGGAQAKVASKLIEARHPGVFDKIISDFEAAAAARIFDTDISKVKLPPFYVDYDLLPHPLKYYAINLFTALGCTYNCFYCQDRFNPFFENSLDAGIGGIKKHIPQKSLVHVFDSCLGVKQERLPAVLEEIKNTGHKYFLSCDMRAETVTPEIVKKMAQAGFAEVRLGLETPDEAVLMRNSRTLTSEGFEKACRIVRDNSDIYIAAYTVTGIASTTEKTIKYNAEYYSKLLIEKLVNEVKTCMYVPYPNQYIDYKRAGIKIVDENWSNYDRQSYPVYELSTLSREKLWRGFLDVFDTINTAWKQSLNLDTVPDEMYPEYINYCYLDKKKK